MTTPAATTATTEAVSADEHEQGMRRALPAWARSARTRLAVSMLALLALSSLVSVLALRQILLSRTGDRVDRSLEQEVREFQRLAALGRDPRNGQPFGDDVRAVFEVFLARNVPAVGEAFFTFIDGVPFRASSNRVPEAELLGEIAALGRIAAAARGEVRSGDDDIRYLAVPIVNDGDSRGTFVVTIDIGGERAEVNEAVRVAAGVSIAVFLISALIVFGVVGRVLAPVRSVTETARAISESDLTRRIEVEGDDELAQLARTFNGMLDRLEVAFAGQRRFLSDAGHELRTPITIVRGHLEVMGDDPVDRRETVALVTDELDRMGRMVDELLLLERTQRPGFLRLDPIDLNELAEDTVAKARAIANRDWRLGGARDGGLVADRQRMQQALLNLAENAAKYTRDGDRITVGAERRADGAALWVADTGPGIDPAEQGRLFDRFHRGESSRGNDEGTGLGLAVVRAIAEAHGGRVELESSPGAGSTFTLIVPDSAEGPA